MPRTDRPHLLLLNCSNYRYDPIYPYAFVQLRALARRHGIKTTCRDLLGIGPRESYLRQLIDEVSPTPTLIGVHLRQTDLLCNPAHDVTVPRAARFFPVEDTRLLLERIREITSAPTVVGGFGLTCLARRLVERLQPDFAVVGSPDRFLARLDDVLARRGLGEIDNLVFREDGGYRFNRRVHSAPPAMVEYNDEVLDDHVRFYGTAKYHGEPPSIPVEVSRGCAGRCYFCVEPHVKGHTVRCREIDAIVEDARFLASRQLTELWFVSSEINSDGGDFALRLAERMLRLNEERRGLRPIIWSSYILPTIPREELQLLLRAGFKPGWNDYLSFDDENLARCNVPYTVGQMLAFKQTLREFEAIDSRQAQTLVDQRLDVFLGNAFVTPRAIHRTLRVIDEAGLAERSFQGRIIAATRVFEVDGALTCGTEETIVSLGSEGFDIVQPSFFYPPMLLERLGGLDAVGRFYSFIEDTFLSRAYEENLSWSGFLGQSISIKGFVRLLEQSMLGHEAFDVETEGIDEDEQQRITARARATCQAPDVETVRGLLFPLAADRERCDHVAGAILICLLQKNLERFDRILDYLRIPHEGGYFELSEYQLMKLLYERHDSNEALVRDVRTSLHIGEEQIEALYLDYVLYSNNVRIRPEYRDLLFGDGEG